MKKELMFFSCCASLLIGCSSSQDTIQKNIMAPGAEVSIMMNNGREYEGELLRVYDSTMTICEKYNAREKDLMDSVFTIYTIKNYDIILIELMEGNYALYGIIFGGVMGGAIGAAVYKSEEKKEEPKPGEFHFDLGLNFDPLAGCCIGGLIGAFAGGIIGYNAKDYEVVYEQADPEEYDFKKLNIYARYVNNEPEFLKKIK